MEEELIEEKAITEDPVHYGTDSYVRHKIPEISSNSNPSIAFGTDSKSQEDCFGLWRVFPYQLAFQIS